MLPDPLHPALVHIPIGIAIIQPIIALWLLLEIQRKKISVRAWVLFLILQGLLCASMIITKETGEADGERLELLIDKTSLETHKEQAELFFVGGWITLLASLAGLFSGTLGNRCRWIIFLLSTTLLLLALRTGDSGGVLVFRENAPAHHQKLRAESGTDASEEK